jgi:hypothetical protein
MTKPETNETKEAFLHRFMSDADARRDYANETERFERAAAIWENRAVLGEAANSLGYNAERDGAEAFGGPHIQPGVVGYPEMVHPISKKKGIAILVEKETLDRMRPTMKGVPIVNWAHDMSGGSQKWLAEGKAVGVVADNRWDSELGYDFCETMIWDKEAKANARNGFRWSNAWKDEDIDWTPGVHNGIPYDGRLVAAHYTHLAIVPEPRYKGAVIFANTDTPGGLMFNLFGKDGKKVELAKDAMLEVGGKKVSLEEVVNSMASAEAEKAKVSATLAKDGVLGEKDSIEIGGKKYNLAEVTNALAASEKVKTDAEAARKAAESVAAKPLSTAELVAAPEFVNAVAAAVTAGLEKAKGDGFFNAVDKIAKARGQGEEAKGPKLQTQRERLKAGAKRFGGKPAEAAE